MISLSCTDESLSLTLSLLLMNLILSLLFNLILNFEQSDVGYLSCTLLNAYLCEEISFFFAIDYWYMKLYNCHAVL